MRRVIDQALCDRAALLARAHPLGTVAAILKLHPSQVTRMRKRGWQAADHRSMFRARPTDFAILSARMTWGELTAHYRCGNSTLARWFAETPGRRASMKGAALTRAGRAARAARG
ncbi:hypothetical protein [Sphingomonas sp. VNH70]|uniref:hypothetical protein n=1 Tax=Sphingomonas silueang TaxID=3156617 RepID=UPI0032B31C52